MRFTRVLFLVALFALVVAPVALALRFTDDSFNTAIGYTATPYSFTFHGAAGCGPALPYQYRLLDGALPPGLSLAKSGVISGVPTRGGDYSFWVELSDENPPSQSWCVPSTAERQFTIKILAGLNLQQNALNPKGAFLGQAYSFQLTTDNPAAATSWSVTGGALPPGITLNSSNGLLSGTPTAAGDYTFTIKVSDGGQRSDSESYTLSIVPELKIGAVRSVGELGTPFTTSPGATGGKPAYKWALGAGTTLPAGLTLDAATGAISGTPTAVGTTSFQLVVTDSLGLSKSETVPFNTVALLALAKAPLPIARAGGAYSTLIRKTGGARPYRWSAVGLPRGLRLSVATGRLAGTPTKAGTYRLRIRVADVLGAASTRTYVLKVRG